MGDEPVFEQPGGPVPDSSRRRGNAGVNTWIAGQGAVMKVWDRFADYVIIGALFWFSLLALAFAVDVHVDGQQEASRTMPLLIHWKSQFDARLFGTDHAQAYAGMGQLLSAMGAMGVLATGIIIDMISALMSTLYEAMYLIRCLKSSQGALLASALDAEGDADGRDAVHRMAAVSWVGLLVHGWTRIRGEYIKLFALILILSLKSAQGARLDCLNERLTFHRMGRALLGVFSMLALVLTLVLPQQDVLHQRGVLLFIYLMTGVGLLFAMTQYARLINTMMAVIRLAERPASAVSSGSADNARAWSRAA